MINGAVVGLQARVNIVLRLPGRPDVEIECVVDTGFEGTLTLPLDIIDALDLHTSRASELISLMTPT